MVDRLMKVQATLKVTKDNTKQGIQFKYRTAEDILEKAKPLCLDNGLLLTLSDSIINIGADNYIESTASVTDGEKTISCKGLAKEPIKLMAMSAPQITGSCSSYARKTALGGLFAIDNNEDPDSNNNSSKKSKDEVDTRQQIINALGHPNITETKRQYYRDEMKAGNIGFNEEFLARLKKEHNIK